MPDKQLHSQPPGPEGPPHLEDPTDGVPGRRVVGRPPRVGGDFAADAEVHLEVCSAPRPAAHSSKETVLLSRQECIHTGEMNGVAGLRPDLQLVRITGHTGWDNFPRRFTLVHVFFILPVHTY